MNNKRAKEIFNSPNMINVTFNGIPVYIESVNEDNNTAKIRFFNQSNKIDEVSIINLVEH
ncbi:H-type small acid-soluble spore protein [Proteiniborus sp. MB09-C3]|uniref:H-type small acid-soluble spore protein n=1 Tax=Proteiniborus sp. MB09-C3 TaxID=3050072 RepID=UPI0025554F23|nr:H-type small acid-soluble spore protein [Proteiniborus sp. MB09-C3]WIV10463.1 H-type small acid-soluble spore protein [Proteiniborus sp. MB09-C3]